MLLETLGHFTGEECEVKMSSGKFIRGVVNDVFHNDVKIRLDDVTWFEKLPISIELLVNKEQIIVKVENIETIRNLY